MPKQNRATKWTYDGTMGVMQYANTSLVNDVNFIDDQGNPASKVSVELLIKVAEWAANKNNISTEILKST